MSWIDWKRPAKMRPIGGLAGWLVARMARESRPARRLELLERIALAPRQSLALIEAEGRRLLVATSAEGPPAFYHLEGFRDRSAGPRSVMGPNRLRRISW